jgi:hypothetical protein
MENFNIYDRIISNEKEIEELKKMIKILESKLVDQDKKNDLDLEDDLEGFYTVNDILRKYKISRQTLYKYRKLSPLKKSTKIGRFDRFKKKNVNDFITKIIKLKQTNPELFKVDFRKAS